MPEPEFITHDFKLPVHDNELSNAGDKIEKLKIRLNKTITNSEPITDKEFVNVFEEIVRVLDYVGRLSIPAFNIGDKMQEMYKMKFLHAPQLAKQLWLNHFENIHKPYLTCTATCHSVSPGKSLNQLYSSFKFTNTRRNHLLTRRNFGN